MTISHDTVTDAVYVSMTNEKIAKTVKVSDRLNVDIDENGNTVGLEILDASSQEEFVATIQNNVENGIPVTINTSTPVVI